MFLHKSNALWVRAKSVYSGVTVEEISISSFCQQRKQEATINWGINLVSEMIWEFREDK